MRRLIILLALVSCSKPNAHDEPQVKPASSDVQPLPDGPGKDAFAAACLTCHSHRYVMSQPVFSRKTWTAEVDKMIKAYGAPVQPEQAPKIVDYLMAIRGAP